MQRTFGQINQECKETFRIKFVSHVVKLELSFKELCSLKFCTPFILVADYDVV